MRVRALVAAVVAVGLLTPAADAATFLGRPWPGHRITYAVTSPTLRAQVRIAARAWNRSGARVKLVETSRLRARLLISPFKRRPCFGKIGQAIAGYPGAGRRSRMFIQPSCAYGVRVMTAAHEFGHVLGLGHEDRRCALMSSVYLARCHPQPLEWEWFCQPARPDDVRGAVRLYGGRYRRPSGAFCIAPSVPGKVARLADQADPAGSLARVRLTFTTPSSARLKRVTVSRRKGRACPDTPIVFGVAIQQRVGSTPRFGSLVADRVDPGRARPIAIDDLEVTGTGTWCYTVFTLDRLARWRVAGTRIVTRGPEPPLAKRIGLTAKAVGAPVAGVQLSWTNPTTPIAFVDVQRASGACAAAAGRLGSISTASTVPGPATFTDSSATAGTWCYGIRFVPTTLPARPLLATVQITVT